MRHFWLPIYVTWSNSSRSITVLAAGSNEKLLTSFMSYAQA
ncbi:MAG: hypothetical protein ACJ8EY_11920 [Sphingomicrobium sp.]